MTKTTIAEILKTTVTLFNYSGISGTRFTQLSAIDERTRMVSLDIDGNEASRNASAAVTVRVVPHAEQPGRFAVKVTTSFAACQTDARGALAFSRWTEQVARYAIDLQEKLNYHEIRGDVS
jgi:hypothetical protein